MCKDRYCHSAFREFDKLHDYYLEKIYRLEKDNNDLRRYYRELLDLHFRTDGFDKEQLVDNLEYVLDNVEYISIKKANGTYEIDFQGYVPVRNTSLRYVVTQAKNIVKKYVEDKEIFE